MNKRIISLLLSVVMIVSMLVSAVPVYAVEKTPIKITADNTEVLPGDVITFTITLGPVAAMGVMQMTIVIPEGLTYVTGSGKLAENLKETLGYDDVLFNEAYLLVYGIGSAANYSSTEDTVLATFQCSVDEDFAGPAQIGLTEIEIYDNQTWDDLSANFETVSDTVTKKHVHVYDQTTVKDEYKVSDATCQKKAVYKKSCVCGLAGDETFEYGDIADHVWATKYSKDETGHWYACTTNDCTEKKEFATHTPDHEGGASDEYAVRCSVCDYLIHAMLEHTCVFNREVVKDEYKVSDATCHNKAVYKKSCKCGAAGEETFEYGELRTHVWDACTKDENTLKTAGNCRDAAVYYYSCSLCGDVELNDEHTFTGEKVADNHVGGTTVINQLSANHKTQTDGYTGDTQCNGCFAILEYGEKIPAGEHTAGDWCTDGEYHWKECTATDCGVVIEGSKGAHSSTGNNVATCQNKAICDACNATYGELADHAWATEYSKDATGHWYACTTNGCTEKKDFAAHTPDHEGGASDEYPVKCSVVGCEYVIYEQLKHVCVFDREVATDKHIATTATCQKKATYYKSCKCGANGTETFEYGELADHNWQPATCTEPKHCGWCPLTEGEPLDHVSSDWLKDKDGRWKECTRPGCGEILYKKEAHKDANDDGICDTCEYVVVAYRTFTFDANGGEGEMAAVRVVEGEDYDLPANEFKAPKGMMFAGWNVNGTVYAEGATITISGNMTATATWQKENTVFEMLYKQLIILHNKKYDIVASAGEGGTITPEGTSKVKFQRSITYTITPDAGYAIKSVIVDGKDVGAVSEYTFKTVRGNHTIKAVFEAKSPYSDVAVNDWFYGDVLFVTENNLMNGTGNGKFSPATTTDRAMIVTVLWRLEGSPVVDGDIQFTDVADGQWYTDAIKWAAKNGIVNGYGDGKFGPTNEITREQVMAILNRYADYKDLDKASAASADGYTYSEWAAENVAWAISNGITNNIKVDVKDMTAKADRAEIAAYLTRFCQAFID